MRTARFEVFQDKRKQWRWRLVSANGRQIAQGESHTRERDAWRAAETVKKTAEVATTPWLWWHSTVGQYADGSSYMTVQQKRRRANNVV